MQTSYILAAGICALGLSSCCVGPQPPVTVSVSAREHTASIIDGQFEYASVDGLDFVSGPADALLFIRQDALEGKKELAALLESEKRHVQYFAVVALSQIGDWESRKALYVWARAHSTDQKVLATVIATRLIWMNDFRLLDVLATADVSNSFVMGPITAMGRAKLDLNDMYLSSDQKENASHLRRIMEFLSEIPPAVRSAMK